MQILFQNSELSPNVPLEGRVERTCPWLWRLQCMDIEKEKGFRSKFTADGLLLMPFTSYVKQCHITKRTIRKPEDGECGK